MSQNPAESPDSESTPGTPKPDSLEPLLRALLVTSGIVLLVAGVLAAFGVRDGVATAALIAAGFALVFVGYFGQRITRIRVRDFEAEMERVEKKVTATLQVIENKARQTMNQLEEVARSYEATRATWSPGGNRDAEMERQVTAAMRLARSMKWNRDDVEGMFNRNNRGDRILVLAAMKENPELRDFDMVLRAIEKPHAGFDQDRFLVLACEMIGELDGEQHRDQREKLRRVVERQREKWGADKARWFTSGRLLVLLDRLDKKT